VGIIVDPQTLETVAAQFQPATGAGALHVEPYGSGNINDTFLVRIDADAERRFILQRINQKVFPYPRKIMENLRTITEHIDARIGPGTGSPVSSRRWELPAVVSTRAGQDYVIDDQDGFWRALTFITGARTLPKVRDAQHAGEAGYALGTFQRSISDLDVARLHDTLPGFHIMPQYLRHYDEVLETHGADLSVPEIRYGVDFVAQRRDWGTVLQDASAAGRLLERPIHGDPKIDNIMIDDLSGEAVGIIDLDTVKPGLVQYDIGDCLRSSCNPLGEDTHDLEQVRFELDLCEVILKGYLPEVREFYSDADYAYLFDSVRVLAFEMGLRFFMDHLEGDVYFKIRYPGHNLMRALVQFHLMEDIEAQEAQVRRMVQSLATERSGAR
jgi:hypothetical protein